MGTIDSLNLFDFNELILFSFYWMSRSSYRRVADVGANLGLHSIILSRSGFEVRAFEPDPQHFALLQRNLQLNHCFDVCASNKAVSNREGKREFVRVVDNTTASHIESSRPNPYGPLERFRVEAESINPLIRWADLIKLDVEGHEKEILLETNREDWVNTDALVEVQNETNAKALYEHFSSLGIPLFSQKTGWGLVRDFTEMPTSYHEGTLFVSRKNEMPWRECKAPEWWPGVSR
jgi:FkbM family methyltransferase